MPKLVDLVVDEILATTGSSTKAGGLNLSSYATTGLSYVRHTPQSKPGFYIVATANHSGNQTFNIFTSGNYSLNTTNVLDTNLPNNNATNGIWHTTNNYFIAPIAGVYYFNANVLKNNIAPAYMDLRFLKNGVMIGDVAGYSDSYPLNTYKQASIGMVIELAQNDQVSLRCGYSVASPSTESVYGDSNNPHTTFTGFLIA